MRTSVQARGPARRDGVAMATIYEEVLIDVEPAAAWDALAD
ncbi:MAG: hypothetical protein ABW167_05080 [Baekduia sp.]